MDSNYVVALHGGAGVNIGRDYAEVETHLKVLAAACERMLRDGASALDTVEFGVSQMEASGLYVAGRGSAPNSQGVVECDAAIMDGALLKAGGVCALTGIEQPVCAARAVLEQSPYVLLAGQGAHDFALDSGLAKIKDPDSYFRTPVGVDPEEMAVRDQSLSHGTVGAVALDRYGRLAAATSTGGLLGKLAGRVGDTPLTGIGNWADSEIAISCTGIGEAFIYAGGARDVANRIAYGGSDLDEAAQDMLVSVAHCGGDGGLIAVRRDGSFVMPFNSDGMKRAIAGSKIKPCARIH